jgi:hypothetical protein
MPASRPELVLNVVYHHDDFDGVVAAAMLCAWQQRSLETMPVTYGEVDQWLARRLPPGAAVVDFLFRPEAALWIDHHDTSFRTVTDREQFLPDAFHVWDTAALSCPSAIISRDWFPRALRQRFATWARWADVVDSARYQSPSQAMDLRSPYLRLAASVSGWVHTNQASAVIAIIAKGDVRATLRVPVVAAAGHAVAIDRETVRRRAQHGVSPSGRVARLDQGHLRAAYNRYLPFMLSPTSQFAVAIYAARQGWVVSVGENPWNRPAGGRNLGEMCRRYGGGGRLATAGVPVHDLLHARAIADELAAELDAPFAPRS